MASKAPPKSAGPPPKKPSGKKAKPLSQREQSARFKETARELGVDESGQQFTKAVEALLHPLPKKRV